MNLSKEYVNLYDNYLKYINEVNKEIRSIKNMKKRVLKRGDFAPENEVLELEGKTIRDIDDVDTKKPKNKIYKFSNGDVYVGKFLEGKMEGKGSYTFFVDEGTVMEYIGEFKEDKKNGKGNFIFSNGNEYIGYFEEDMMSGIGNMLYSSKDEYIGTWKNGKKDGKGIYKWSMMDDKLYLDGMFCDNMPIGLLEDKGYEDVVVIRLIDDFIGKMNLNRHQNINIKTIIPSEYLGGSLNKDRDNVEKNIRLGYLDTMKAYERCTGIKYYFDVEYKYNEEYCFDKFRSMSNETIQYICNLLNIKRDASLRTVMESVIPKLGEVLGLPKDFSYKDLFYCIYEKKLEENNINRIKLYDFNKVIDVVNTNIDSNRNLASNFEVRPKISIKKNKNTKLLTNCIIKDIKNQS
ncbi:MORN repeat family protein [Clostridioides difficile Y184]|nr:MORN repeat family protein [Clostridioides difficile Y184]